MSERIRVYHPVTDEPFDLPVLKANELILNDGWRKQPIDPDAVPAVQTVGRGSDTTTDTVVDDWRTDDVETAGARQRSKT